VGFTREKCHQLGAVLAMLMTAASVHAQLARPPSPALGNPADTLPSTRPSPMLTPGIDVQIQRPTPALQQQLNTRVTPTRFRIEGVQSLPFDQVAAQFAPLAGREVTIAELLKQAASVTQIYQDAGYPLSFAFVPAQNFDQGVVLITVVEGYVDKVTINGNAGRSEDKIRKVAGVLQQSKPLRRADFERYSRVLGLLPGMSVSATVHPPRTTDGASEMVLEVKRKAYSFNVATEFRDPGVRAVATATVQGLTPLAEHITASALFPRGRDKESYYALNIATPVGTEGMKVQVNASAFKGSPRSPWLESIGFEDRYRTETQRAGVALSYPVLLNNAHDLTVTAGVYGTNTNERFTQRGTGARAEISTDSRVVHVETTYNENQEKLSRSITLGLYKGVDALGANKRNSGADLEFFRTRLTATQAHALPGDFGLVLSGAMQYSNNPLPSAEQMSFGGRFFGMGYRAGDLAGDKGWGLSIEINKRIPLPTTYVRTVQPYLLADTARAYINGPNSFSTRIASVGAGIRISDDKHYQLDLGIAQPVGDLPSATMKRSPRFNAAYAYNFE
jgi:hemolysin activation/secretion protein